MATRPLNIDHYQVIRKALWRVKPQWRNIGLTLGIPLFKLNEFGGSLEEKMDQMLKMWLNHTYSTPTWGALVDALRDDIVEGGRPVAAEVETKYISGGQSVSERPSLAVKKTLLDSYAKYLRGWYSTKLPEFFTLQWPPPPTHKVFNLAIIGHQTIQREPLNEELVRLTLRGAVDDIMRRKSSIQLKNLFKLDNRKRKIILIEGAPGAGKSTLAWHIVQKWKSGELFQEFKVVVFVHLRDPAIQSAKSLADILPARSTSMRTELQSAMEACDGHGVLLVLDGWDEYGPGLQHGSLFQQLICSPDIHCSSLIITSRPIASGELQRYASSRVEIVGFTSAEVKKYFIECIQDNDEGLKGEGESGTVQIFQDHLRERPVIEASCYLPLNAAIIVHLFLSLDHTLPHTLHEVFLSLVCCCITRHLTREAREGENSPEILSLDDLPPDVLKLFNNICTMAYHGVMENEVTFSATDLRSFNLPTEFSTLSLIRGVQNLAAKHFNVSFNFLHLSVQELLAAFHISKLSATEQIQIFNELFDQPRLAAVFWFYAAFTKLQTEGVRDIVARIVQKEEKPLLVNLLHGLYEAQDTSLCQFVASHLKGKLDLSWNILSPIDCLVVGYFLSSVCLTTSGEFKVDLSRCSLDDYRAGFLIRELSKCSNWADAQTTTGDEVPGCLTLDLRSHQLSGHGIGSLLHIFNVVSSIYLSDPIQNDSFKTNMSLKRLSAGKCGISEKGCKAISDALMVNRSLQVLDLCDNPISPGVVHIAESLKYNHSLLEINLSRCGIPEEGGKAIGDALVVNRSLETLTLKRNNLSDGGAAHITDGLSHNDCLKRLDISSCCIGDQGMKSLGSALEVNRSLEELDSSGNNAVTGVGLLALGESLKRNRGLKTLKLGGLPNVLDNDWKQFIVCLQNSYLTELELPYSAREVVQREMTTLNNIRKKYNIPLLKIDFDLEVSKEEIPFQSQTPKYGPTELEQIIKKKTPQEMPQMGTEALEKFSEEVDIIIHTVTDNEYWAAVDCMDPPVSDDGNPLWGSKTSIVFPKVGTAIGMFGGYKSALVQTGMGESCREDIESVFQHFRNAKAIIAVGVAYSLSPEKCVFGDVLVSQSIEDVKFATDGSAIERSLKAEVRPYLEEVFCRQTHSFKDFTCTKEGRKPSIIPGTIVSMPWLVDNVETYMRILPSSSPEAVGLEMEGYVLMQIQKELTNQHPPCHIDVIIIKGVVDYGDGTKTKEWHLTAAMAAVCYARHKLEGTGGGVFETANVMKELIRNEMRQGYVSADLTTCLASGPPGVGKSTLECLLFGQIPPEIRISTACIEQAQRAVITYQDSDISEGNEWKKVEAGDLKTMCAEQMKANSVEVAVPNQSQDATTTRGQEGTPTAAIPTRGQEGTPTAVTTTPGDDMPTAVISGHDVTTMKPVQIMESIRDRQPAVSEDSRKQTIPIQHKPQISDWVMPSETAEILKLMETSSGFRQLLDVHWVHFIDTGGQEEFLEILPAFVRNISLQMLIFKLSEQLRSIPTVEYYNKDGKGYEIGHFTLTNEEMLLKAAKMSLFHQAEVSLSYSDMVGDYPEPKILVVGTFKDQENATEGIHKKNDQLCEVLQPYRDHLITRSEKEIIYPVNARLAGQGDREDPVASELRHAIERYSPRLKMKIPLRWYLLELELRKLGLILSRSQCWEIAQRLHFESEEALEVALQYLHEANLFLYYPDVLDSVVFVNSKALLDVITQLFELHIDLRDRDECDIISDDDLQFRKQAIFSARTLSDCSTRAEYDKNVLTDEDLAKLLQHRLIIADISIDSEVPEHKYFMPSLLPVNENLNDCRPCETAADPLQIIFPKDCTPNGLFCAMQVQLLSRSDPLQWRIIALQPTDHIYKNCIQFSISDSIGDDSITITVINVNTHFEVYPHTTCPADILPHILRCLDESLRKACATFSYKALHEFAFSCVCGKAPPHSAVFVQDGLTKTCIMNPREPEPLSSKQVPWVTTTKGKGVTTVSPPLPPLLPHHRQDPRFPGIIFYGDPILKMVDSDGCKLARPEIGICLHVPPKAVPDGKALHLSIWPCLSGPFVPPEGHEFSSPVYLISPAFQFQEDVELSINHFENLRCQEDVASMSFATTLSSAKIHTSKPVYTFESLEKGEFKVTSSVGTIYLRHFCRDEFCQVAATRKCQSSPQDDEQEAVRALRKMKEHSYCVQLHHSTCPQDPSYAVFAVSLYQNLYLTNLKKSLISQFPNHRFYEQSIQPVYLSGDAVELKIPKVQGWSVCPSILPAKIFQKQVDFALIDPNCGSLHASYPPRLLVTIKPGAQATDSECVLPVRGLQEELSFAMALSLPARSQATAMHQGPQDGKPKIWELSEVIKKTQGEWKYLAERLYFENCEVTPIQENNSSQRDMCRDMLGKWLEGLGEREPRTWRTLLQALREMEKTELADELAAQLK